MGPRYTPAFDSPVLGSQAHTNFLHGRWESKVLTLLEKHVTTESFATLRLRRQGDKWLSVSLSTAWFVK